MMPIRYKHPTKGNEFGYIKGIIPAGSMLDELQMQIYAGIDETNNNYRSVKGPAKVDRLIIEKDNGNYLIGPIKYLLRDVVIWSDDE